MKTVSSCNLSNNDENVHLLSTCSFGYSLYSRLALLVGADKKWSAMSVRERRSCVLVILDCLEVASEERRLAAIRALAYLCQGK